MNRRTPKNDVFLNVYDLHPESNTWLYGVGLGFYHTGIEVNGIEYTFGSGAGIFTHAPRQAGEARFREAIKLGEYEGLSKGVQSIVDSMKDEFEGSAYNTITKNCNSFSNELSMRLLNRPIPGFVNRLAYMGSFVTCLLPKQLTNEAPVTAPATEFTSFRQIPPATSYQAFAGRGHSVGASSQPLDPATLRERRLAALAASSPSN